MVAHDRERDQRRILLSKSNKLREKERREELSALFKVEIIETCTIFHPHTYHITIKASRYGGTRINFELEKYIRFDGNC